MELKNDKCIEALKSFNHNTDNAIIIDPWLLRIKCFGKSFVGFELDNEYFDTVKSILKFNSQNAEPNQKQ